MLAILIQARGLSTVFSKSLARRWFVRFAFPSVRLSQAVVRSTTHRLGSSSKSLAVPERDDLVVTPVSAAQKGPLIPSHVGRCVPKARRVRGRDWYRSTNTISCGVRIGARRQIMSARHQRTMLLWYRRTSLWRKLGLKKRLTGGCEILVTVRLPRLPARQCIFVQLYNFVRKAVPQRSLISFWAHRRPQPRRLNFVRPESTRWAAREIRKQPFGFGAQDPMLVTHKSCGKSVHILQRLRTGNCAEQAKQRRSCNEKGMD